MERWWPALPLAGVAAVGAYYVGRASTEKEQQDSSPHGYRLRTNLTDENAMRIAKFLAQYAPPLDFKFHKGQHGRLAVVGGSKDYTGAPYYAGMAALQAGAELVYILTAEEACIPIKSYSPELMVSPFYSAQAIAAEEKWATQCAAKVTSRLPRLHALIIGPGLGRRVEMVAVVKNIIKQAASLPKPLPIVIDADGLWMVTQAPEIVRCANVILTPNKVEFDRLWKAVCGEQKRTSPERDIQHLSKAMGGVTIIHKGPSDLISSGVTVLKCSEKGAPRRPGGIGDVLSGIVGLFVAWAEMGVRRQEAANEKNTTREAIYSEAAYCACTIVRKSWEETFLQKRRSSGVPDLLQVIGRVLNTLDVPLEKLASKM